MRCRAGWPTFCAIPTEVPHSFDCAQDRPFDCVQDRHPRHTVSRKRRRGVSAPHDSCSRLKTFPQEQEIETAETVVLVAAEGRIAHDVRAAQCVVKVERDRAPGGGGGFGKLADAPHMQAATRAEEPSFARPGRRGRLPLRERRKETCSANRGTKCKAEDAGQEAAEPFPRSQSPAAARKF